MPNTYTQLHIQFVFAVKYRAALIHRSWKDRLQEYMTGITQSNQHKLLQINNLPDHMHILVGFRPNQAISAFVQNLKTESTKWIKTQNLSPTFAWQEGYGAFSYSKSHVPMVIRYIQNQERHHQRQSFLEEYRKMLTLFEIEWNEQYIFKELE